MPGNEPRVLVKVADFRAQNEVAKWFCNPNLAESFFTADKLISPANSVAVSDKWASDLVSFEAEIARAVLIKFHPVGTASIRGIFDHEIGHQLDALLDLRKDKEIRDVIDSMTDNELTENLSQYSWDNAASKDRGDRYQEAIAEAWSEYCNNPNCRGTAKAIGERIEYIYDQKFGR